MTTSKNEHVVNQRQADQVVASMMSNPLSQPGTGGRERVGVRALPDSNPRDQKWMRRALTLASRGFTPPNPMVGCVIVKNDVSVGEGYHVVAGQPHAEVNALRQSGRICTGRHRLRNPRTLLLLWQNTSLYQCSNLSGRKQGGGGSSGSKFSR